MTERAQAEPETSQQARDPDPVETIEIATAVLMRNFELLRRRSDSYTDLDRSEYLLLRTLEHTGPTDIATLADALGLDHSTAARQVSAMRHKELITRSRGSADRRRCVITPTGQGHERLEATRRRRRCNTAALLADWSPEDLHTLARMFTRYNQAVARAFLTPPPAPPQPLAALDPTTAVPRAAGAVARPAAAPADTPSR